jgi:hypothetical protein
MLPGSWFHPGHIFYKVVPGVHNFYHAVASQLLYRLVAGMLNHAHARFFFWVLNVSHHFIP